MSLRVFIAGGGTGGHVYPALAVVDGLRKRDPQAVFMWIGNPNRIEARVIPGEGIEFRPVLLRGFRRRLDPKSFIQNIGTVYYAAMAMRKARKIISDFKPDVAIGTGGYISGPPIAQAAKMDIPTALIEPNTYPGLTVRWLAKRVDRIFLGDEIAMKELPDEKCIVTGTPVSSEIISATRPEGIHAYGLLAGKPCMLIVGGSQGAENINCAILEFIHIAHAEEKQLLTNTQILHQTGGKGPLGLDGIRLEYPEADYVKVSYIDRMPLALAAADIIISRAGAATLSEIKARGIPSVLIPYPYAAEGHQLKNAKAMEAAGASIVIEDKHLNGRKLFDTIIPLLRDKGRMESMGVKAKAMYRPDCVERICDEIQKLAASKKID